MNTSIPGPPYAKQLVKAKPVYGLKHALILMGLLVVGAALLALVLVGFRQISGANTLVPSSHKIDAEKFEDRYGAWGELTNFQAKSLGRDKNTWKFSATLELPDRHFNELKWYIEMYQEGKLINVFSNYAVASSSQLTNLQKQQAAAAKRRGNQLIYLSDERPFHFGDPSKPYQFLTFAARHGASCTAVPVTSVLQSNSSGSSKPVVYERSYRVREQIQLSDGKLELEGGHRNSGMADRLKFKYKITDEEFSLAYDVDANQASNLYFVVENEFGSLLQFTAMSSDRFMRDEEKEVALRSPPFANHPWEKDWLRRGPLKVYIAKMDKRSNFKHTRLVGIAETLKVYSNILTIEK